MRTALAVVLAAVAAAPARAVQGTLNPDRWTSIELSEAATESIHARQTLFGAAGDASRDFHNTLVSLAGDANFPLSDEWSVRVGVGTDLANSQFAAIPSPSVAASSSDNSALNASLAPRYFFTGQSIVSEAPAQNPDRWPSLGLQLRGSWTLSFGDSSTGQFPQDVNTRVFTGTLDSRLPLSDAVTLIPQAGFTYSGSDQSQTPISGGSKSITRSVLASLDARYYFVGKNLISRDTGDNPDRWSMIHASFGGSREISGQTFNYQSGAGVVRGTNAHAFTADFGTRLPISNHLTLLLDVTGAWSRSWSDEAGTYKGSRIATPSVNYSSLIRYYFF